MHPVVTQSYYANDGKRRVSAASEMLALFSPSRQNFHETSTSFPIDNVFPWQPDPVRRAANLVQLATSLANLAEHPSRAWLPQYLVVEAHSLTRAYQTLHNERGASKMLSCALLLVEISTRLTAIFGHMREISLTCDCEPVVLYVDMRRVLILIGNELVINALKYGYPTMLGGTIDLRLINHRNDVELIVEDDGVGYTGNHPAGTGETFVGQLSRLIGAQVTRTTGADGCGYRVSVLVPKVN